MAWVLENWEAILGIVATVVPVAIALCIAAANQSASIKDDMICAKVDRVWSAFTSILPTTKKHWGTGNNLPSDSK